MYSEERGIILDYPFAKNWLETQFSFQDKTKETDFQKLG